MKSLILGEHPCILEEITDREMQYFTNLQDMVGASLGIFILPSPPPPGITRIIRQFLCTYVIIKLFLKILPDMQNSPFQ